MERRWVVHIADLRAGPALQRCVRCGIVLDINQEIAASYQAGALLAIRHRSDRTEWQVIADRDDLGPDEVPCEGA